MTENNIIEFQMENNNEITNIVKSKKLKYNIVTYGCAMNEHDSEQISGILEKIGFVKSDFENADLILFNTCCVRDNAEHKLFGNVGALKERKSLNKNMLLGVCGCMMQQKEYAENLKKRFPFVDIIFGTHNIQNLPSMIMDALSKKQVVQVFDTDGYIVEGVPVKRVNSFSAYINIMYGCNNFCTYCIVPYVRGRERSRLSSNIIDEAKDLVQGGVSEITLLGQNVNSYNRESSDLSFSSLLKELSKIDGLRRLKFLTSHPKDLSNELIETISECSNISRHLHLPVQSGDSEVLKNMNRGYSSEDYLRLVDKIKKQIPDIGLTTDIIVGFPGETEKQFENTLDLLKQVKYDGVFSFMYNVRKGTKAENMEGQVPIEIKRRRLQELMQMQNEISYSINSSLVGKRFEVLIEKEARKENQMCGRSMCGKLINVNCSKNYIGKYVKVIIESAHHNSLSARMEEENV